MSRNVALLPALRKAIERLEAQKRNPWQDDPEPADALRALLAELEEAKEAVDE